MPSYNGHFIDNPINDPSVDLEKFCYFEGAFAIKDEQLGEEFLKIIIAHWNINEKNESQYKTYKEMILKRFPNSTFFKMTFFLHENHTNEFLLALQTYLDSKQNMFGNYYKHIVAPNLQLLLVIMENNRKMSDIQELTKIKCPSIAVNSTILKAFDMNHEFNIFKTSFSPKTHHMVSLYLTDTNLCLLYCLMNDFCFSYRSAQK